MVKELKQRLRFATDLVDLAMRKNIQNKGKFVKEAFDPITWFPFLFSLVSVIEIKSYRD
jgi:hypothetical protein